MIEEYLGIAVLLRPDGYDAPAEIQLAPYAVAGRDADDIYRAAEAAYETRRLA